jgi:hypothetical protein
VRVGAAELLLRHLYPDDFQAASDDPHRDGALVAFDQSEFFNGDEGAISLSSVGYLYVPTRCSVEQCRLHVAFHGCRQDLASIHDDFIRDAAYNRWAASNRIVVLIRRRPPPLRIPTDAGHLFRDDVGHRSDLIPATIPR